MDILNIAISSLTMEQTDRRIFACQLLLNIHDCLTMDTIETKLMPLLSELITNETTTSVRFTICFVLANYARRVEFDYFQSIIFPLFEKLSIIVLDNDNSSSSSSNQQQQQNNNSLCTSTTICFALLDSLTSLLSYLLHFNQISMKKQSKMNQQQHCDNEQMPSEKEQPKSNEQNTEKSTKNNVLEFIYQKFLPLLKQTFQRMLDFIDQYRSMSIKIEQDLFNCFLHWRDQIGSHDSITQTLFSHYQSLVLFILILRDYMMNNNDNHQCDNLNIDQRFLMEMFDHDHWYLDFYYRLCAFHYVLPPPPPLTPQSPSQLSSDNTLIDQQQQSTIKPLHNRQLRSRKSLRLKSGQPSRLPVSVVSSVQSSSNKDEDITDLIDIESSNSESSLSLEIERNNHDNKDNIATRLIDILNTLSIDNNYEIAMKMSNIIEKLVERFTEPIRLYSVLTNVLQSQNFDVIAQIIRNFVDVFTSMLNSSQLTAQTNTIIEYVVDTFMRSETYLSTKPKWRLHIQYFDVMFRLSRIIPVDIVKRLIIPRLLLRFSTTRPIPCRQAIARCLLMVYLENFAQHDFEKYCVQSTSVNNGANNQTTMMMISNPLNFDDHDQNAYLSFDLFNWLDRNLRQSQRYQDRQLYIDMLAMFIRFLFRDSIEWRESLPNHYLMDIEEQCPSLMNWSELSYRFSKYRYHLNLKELHSSQFFAMLMIQRYRLLHQLTELATKDRVSTIRTSSCIVLFTLLQCTNYWVINHLHHIPITVNDHCITKTNMIATRNVSDIIDNNDQSQLIEIIMDYYDAYMDNNGTIISEIESSANNNYNSTIAYCTSEQLEIRRQLEKDRIVLEELYKLYTLIDDIQDEGIDLNNDSSELIIDDLVVSESSTLSSSSIIETTAMETVNNSTESESTKCPGLIYVANVDELIVDSNETMDSKGHTSINEAEPETSAVVVINKKVVESSWSIQGNKSFNPNSLKCSTKKRKSPKHHEQQHQQQQSHMNHQRSVSNLALEKHLNTIIKHSDIISNIQQPSIMMMAKTNSTNVNKSGYKGNYYYHHHGINPGHNSGKVSSSSSASLSKKKTSIINSQQRNNNNNNNNGIALLPTPNNNNTVHCGSKVPILSNRNNNNNSHHNHMINNRAGLLHQPLQTKSSSSSLMILPKWHNHNSSNLSIYQHQRSMSVPPPSSSSTTNISLNSNHYTQQNSTMLNVKKKLFKTTGSINPGVVGNVIIGNQSNIRNNHHHHYHHHHHHHYQSNILNTNIDQISSSSSSSSSKNNFIRVKKFKNRTNNEPLLLSSSSSTLKPGNKSMINKNESMETDDNCDEDDDHKNNNNNNNNKGQTSTIIVTTSTSESQPDSST
ncbi:hypothetical protein DERP_009814 [Dermatophagoides pteronyssinus]|uniref:Uncharacterized protein n=1 Tax=Dermatophagoides pteronyssinus TaxID=6956 RepID=A0ABQ8IRH1_DERPT|nr:hypothetical protein DERP_009814 [Dermatophagoides pteronyssinus]